MAPGCEGLDAKEFNLQFGEYLKGEPANAHVVDVRFYPGSGYKSVTLAMGERGSRVRFEFLKGNKTSHPRLRLELNPRKLGPPGFQQLRKVLDASHKGPLQLSGYLQDARVSRLDIAVDIVGAQVNELILTHKSEGKRSTVLGPDGELETLMVHRILQPVKAKLDQAGFPTTTFSNTPGSRS